MADRMPMLPALRAFEAVARLGSVRAAAAELHVTPAAVSRQVKAMEADLGLQLIRRRGNNLELTAAAQAGSDTLSAGFRLLAEAVRQFRDHRARPQIRLSVDPTLAAELAHYRAAALPGAGGQRRPAARCQSSLCRFRPRPGRCGDPFGIGTFPGLEAHFLLAEELFPVCSPKLLRSPHALKQPSDLRHHTLLHNEWSSRQAIGRIGRTGWTRRMDRDLTLARSMPRAACISTMAWWCWKLPSAGRGVYLGNTTAVPGSIAARKLVAPFGPASKAILAIISFVRTSARRRDIVMLRDWLLAEAARDRQAAG